MTNVVKWSMRSAVLMAPILLAACGVSQDQYDSLAMQNQQLQQQVAADKAHIARLQGAIKYTVNSDLLFAPGSWQIAEEGKDTIAKMAKVLAPNQQEKIVVNGYTDNAPIGPALIRQGVTSNQMLSERRAQSVMQYMISQGVNANMVGAQGFGETNPIATNSTPQGRAQNRRVEVTLAGTGR